jgi:hypothetical protein
MRDNLAHFKRQLAVGSAAASAELQSDVGAAGCLFVES